MEQRQNQPAIREIAFGCGEKGGNRQKTTHSGTTEAIVKLIEKMGGEVVKICCVMELAGLKGREKLNGYAVDALITYEGK